jgi:hypothetical protein
MAFQEHCTPCKALCTEYKALCAPFLALCAADPPLGPVGKLACLVGQELGLAPKAPRMARRPPRAPRCAASWAHPTKERAEESIDYGECLGGHSDLQAGARFPRDCASLRRRLRCAMSRHVRSKTPLSARLRLLTSASTLRDENAMCAPKRRFSRRLRLLTSASTLREKVRHVPLTVTFRFEVWLPRPQLPFPSVPT